MPSAGDKVAGLVTHVEFVDNTCHGYVQLCDSETVENLSTEINLVGDALDPIDSCSPGQKVIALFSQDGTWYRAIVEGEGLEKVSVFFMDFGNTEFVSMNDIRQCPVEFVNIPGLATKCNFRDINANGQVWTDSEKEHVMDTLVNGEFMVEILESSKSVLDVRLYDMENASKIIQIGKAITRSEQKPSSIPAESLQVGSSYNAYISFVGSAIKFWVQLKSREDDLNQLMEDLAEYTSTGQPLINVSKGTNCIATYSLDQAPYRSNVLMVNGDKCLVQFVDYGNSESKNVSELMLLPDKFKQLPCQGIKCSYNRTKIDSNTLEEKLQELTSADDGITLNVVSRSDDGYVVEINQIEGQSSINVPQNQFKHEFPSITLELEQTYDVCISYISHPGKFFIHLLENATELDQLMSKLKIAFASAESLSCPLVGMSCLARFSDGSCYRGAIRSVDSAGNACVFAVDFGFEEMLNLRDIKELPAKFLTSPAYCIQCTVDITKLKESYWSDQDILVLKNLESNVALIANVTSKRGNLYQLDLFDTRVEDVDRYVNAEIFGNANSPSRPNVEVKGKMSKPQTSSNGFISAKIPPPEIFSGAQELVCVTAVKSANQFFAQVTKFPLSKIAELQSKINGFYEKLSANELNNVPCTPGTFCCTKYTDGGWYRAMVTSTQGQSVEVSFVDFGDTHILPVRDLKQLKADFQNLSQQCILCQLTTVDASLNKKDIEKMLLNSVIEVRFGEQKVATHKPLSSSSDMSWEHDGTDSYATQKLALSDSVEVEVVFVTNPSEFWCQMTSHTAELQTMMDKMNEVYNSLSPNDLCIDQPEIGLPCVAKYSEDELWYRAEILSFNGEIEVQFVDYGNSDMVQKSAVKKVKKEFMTLPVQGIRCGLNGVKPNDGNWSDKAIEEFEKLTVEKKLSVKVKSFQAGAYLVNLEEDQGKEDIAVKLVDMGHCSILPNAIDSMASLSKDIPSPYSQISVEDGSVKEVFVSWIENPQLFWVQPVEFQEKLDELTNEIQEECADESNVESATNVAIGQEVMGKYEDAWYRAVVENISGDQVKLRFVDYGNADTLPLASLKKPKDKLIKLEAQAIQCSLAGIKPLQPGVWNVDAKDIMESLVTETVSCEFVQKRKNVYLVRLKAGEKNIADELVNTAVVKKEIQSPVKTSPGKQLTFSYQIVFSKGSVEKVYVSQIDSLSAFYCQLVKYETDLVNIMENLKTAYAQNPVILKDLAPGTPCVARYSQDGELYRACVKEEQAGGIEIHFVDYGNSEVVAKDQLYEIKSEFLRLSPQAIPCSLSGASGDLTKFQELVLDKELTAKVVNMSNSTAVIELFDGENQIVVSHSSPAQELSFPASVVPVGEDIKVYTSVVESPSKFYVQLADNEQTLNKVTEDLQQLYANCGDCDLVMDPVLVGNVCCSKYSEDGAWYRAMVQSVNDSKVTVLFVDYGNEDEVEKSAVKTVKQELAVIPPLAYKCSLHGITPADGSWSDDAIAKFESLTMDVELTCTFVTPSTVQLKNGEDDIGKCLLDGNFAVEKESKTGELRFAEQPMPKGEVAMYVSHIDKDFFYLQMESDEDKIAEMAEKLQHNCAASEPVSKDKLVVGFHCVAKYFVDDMWYRAVVTKVKGSGASVRFVDYGNCDEAIQGNLCELSEDFVDAPLGYMCCLSGIGQWSAEQKEMFETLTLEEKLTTVFTGQKGNESCVTDRTEDESGLTSESTADSGLPGTSKTISTVEEPSNLQYVDLKEGQRSQVFVSHVDSPSSFHIQLESEKSLLNQLLDEMFEFYESDEGEKLAMKNASDNMICVAKFSEDGSWYRAIVVKYTDLKNIEVQFVDHGNQEVTSISTLRKLNSSFAVLPVQAIHCALGGVKSKYEEWSEGTKELFTELTSEK
ncbi:hypothetical protein KUTeg_017105 [Tegillarca granosa]|uniref:Tudor domain-containing protein n=1 Tax=Tegillarca granosa TaxID=220873 RepID=A0ABQ9EN09_TEGGR|nr:hypothetical protein KUTeg_017105 [Tegillarca granosa]